MRQRLLLLLPLFLVTLSIQAQNYEVGLLFGASTYSGELTPGTNNLSVGELHPSLGVFVRRNFNRFITMKANLSYGTISGDDANSKDEGRKERNLSFRSRIFELGVTGEFNILGYEAQGLQRRFSPYIFGGVAVFGFNPEANYQGQLVELQPLGTEGQGMENFPDKYKLTQIAIPFGAGVKFAISERLNIGVEVGFRKTFTDYLDDVSGNYVNYNELLRGNGSLAAELGNRTGEYLGTDPIDLPTGTPRGNASTDDWYLISGVTVSYNIFGQGKGLGRGSKGDFGCPTF